MCVSGEKWQPKGISFSFFMPLAQGGGGAGVPQLIPIEQKFTLCKYGSSGSTEGHHVNVLRPNPKGPNLPRPMVPQRLAPFEGFVLARNNFHRWLNIGKIKPLSERRYNQGDICLFRRAHEEKCVRTVKMN